MSRAGRTSKRVAAGLLAVLFAGMQALLPAGAQAQQLVPGTPSLLRLEVDQLSPRTISSTSQTLSISGRITNTGDRRLTGLIVRLQLGERQTEDQQFVQSLSQPPATSSAQTEFFPVIDSLAPGQSAPLSVVVPLGQGQDALQIGRAGTYPLLVNVNGKPDGAEETRLAALTMLLPVLGVPGQSGRRTPANPARVTLLWPIADQRPRIVAAPYGGKAVLSDDELADALSPGGRLDGLVSAAKSVRGNSQLAGSLCFALDGDLLDTVDTMTRGYQVRTPTGPVEGKGAEAAKRWLSGLRDLVERQCVLSMPYADADLPALSRVRQGSAQDSDLVRTAANSAGPIQRLLDTQPLPGVLWPDGAMDARTLDTLSAAGTQTLITDGGRLRSTTPPTGWVSVEGTSLRALPTDPLLTASLAGITPGQPRPADTETTADNPALAVQNGLAGLAYRAGLGSDTTGGTGQQTGQGAAERAPVLVAPPRRWNAPAGELAALLQTVSDFSDQGLLDPVPLRDLLTATSGGTASMDYASQDAYTTLPGEVTDQLSQIDAAAAGLGSAMVVDPTAQVQPSALIGPLRTGLIRAGSTAWRGIGGGALAAVGDARGQLDGLAGRVTVSTPGQPLSLASGTSPLPVYITNNLPVTMKVRITLANSAGLRPDPIPTQTIPTGGLNSYIQTEALRAGRFSVDVSLSTPDGVRLGQTARFDLTSNEYGAVTLIVTISAGAALVLLSGRRIYRRVRESRQNGA